MLHIPERMAPSASTPLARLALATALACTLVGQAVAGSTSAMSISDSITAAAGSVSTSLTKSSQSSSGEDKVADGDYQVKDVAAAADRPGMARLTLQAVAQQGPEGEYFLYVPHQAVDTHGVNQGRVLTAQARPYGVAFALADTREAFFLVLQDAWFQELSTKPVSL